MNRGFTLIEALTTVAIIGILATLVSFAILAAQRQARDAKRKNDLTAVSLAFDARKADKTCSGDLEQFPGAKIDALNNWVKVTDFNKQSAADDLCGPFSQYLKVIPEDKNQFLFNLAKKDLGLDIKAKHFRLAAILERSPLTAAECQRQNAIWVQEYDGEPYSCAAEVSRNLFPFADSIYAANAPSGYNYYVGH